MAAAAVVTSRTLTPLHARYSAYIRRVAGLAVTIKPVRRPTARTDNARFSELDPGNAMDTSTSRSKGTAEVRVDIPPTPHCDTKRLHGSFSSAAAGHERSSRRAPIPARAGTTSTRHADYFQTILKLQ